MVPGLALFDRLDFLSLFAVAGRVGCQEDRCALVSDYKQRMLVGEQDDLAEAVAAVLPELFAGFQIDAAEDRLVEPKDGAVVDDEVVEGGSHAWALPALFDPPGRAVGDD